MPDTLNDGSVPYGVPSVTINSVVYAAEGLSVKEPTSTAERRDGNNIPNAQVTVTDFVTGSGTLQLATTTTAMPPINGTFAVDLMKKGSTQTYYVTDVGHEYTQGEIRKVPIEFRLRINTPPSTP